MRHWTDEMESSLLCTHNLGEEDTTCHAGLQRGILKNRVNDQELWWQTLQYQEGEVTFGSCRRMFE